MGRANIPGSRAVPRHARKRGRNEGTDSSIFVPIDPHDSRANLLPPGPLAVEPWYVVLS